MQEVVEGRNEFSSRCFSLNEILRVLLPNAIDITSMSRSRRTIFGPESQNAWSVCYDAGYGFDNHSCRSLERRNAVL